VAILAPLLKLLIWDRVHRLLVDVEIHEMKTDPSIEQFLKAEANRLRSPGIDEIAERLQSQGNREIREKLEADRKTADTFDKYSYCKCYIRLTIQNTSRKKVAGISLLMSNPPSLWGWAQVDEGPPIKVTAAKIPIGDLQPHHKSVVQIWSSEQLGGWTLKKTFRISADEIDRVRMRFPMPGYLKVVYQKRFLLMVAYVWIVFILILIILAYFTTKP
jgi:hypothetical protein